MKLRPVYFILFGIGGMLIAISKLSAFQLSGPGDCTLIEASASRTFGDAIALSEQYLAVGDSEANRVFVYALDSQGHWSKLEEISPPENSAAAINGVGFGYAVDIDDDKLVIGAYSDVRSPASNDIAYSGAVYFTRIDKEQTSVLVPIASTDLNSSAISEAVSNSDTVPGYTVAVSYNQLAFGGKTPLASGQWVGTVFVTDLDGHLIKSLEAPEGSSVVSGELFGAEVDLHSSTLLVGSPLESPEGGAWLFNLSSAEQTPPLKISGKAGAASFSGSAVVQSEQFSALSAVGSLGASRTVVMGVDNPKTAVIEAGGMLSAKGNLLAIAQSSSRDGERSALVSLFKIEGVEESELLLEIPQAEYAALSESGLAYVAKKNQQKQLCYRVLF